MGFGKLIRVSESVLDNCRYAYQAHSPSQSELMCPKLADRGWRLFQSRAGPGLVHGSLTS